MAAGKSKSHLRPPKKQQKTATLESADDFQEAADFDESAGGKHRVGDPVKSGRAFVRALDIYDKGLQRHPSSFDLAYNKARLQLEISQQPNLIEHIGVPLPQWLDITLESHRYALHLNKENPDVLFNTAQILTCLAEHRSSEERRTDAVSLLQEALELLSLCLSRQELMFEQHQLDFPDVDEGGVSLDSNDTSAPVEDTNMGEGQTATIEVPVSPSDLLDTLHASLSALTTLVPLSNESGLQNLGEMARSLTESKAAVYLKLLPPEHQIREQFAIAVDRATFIAAFANAQFEAQMIELQTYVERLDSFDIAGKDQDSAVLCTEADARTDAVLSALDRFEESPELPAITCWKQLSSAQDLYTQATKLSKGASEDRSADIYQSKGDLELLRHRIANLPRADLSEGIRNSGPTLMRNAQTYYKGAVSHAIASGEKEIENNSRRRLDLAKLVAALMYSSEPIEDVSDPIRDTIEECMTEGLLSAQLAQAIVQGNPVQGSS